MDLKLGEALIKEGLITKEHLFKALERQVIFGGRLGTNLIEMGFIKEDDLTKFLSKTLRVPYAEPSYFEDIDPDVLDLISPAIAEKYIAVPIKKEKKKIHLAMLDPKDFNALDEIRFITGQEIIPYIASELRILHALEKYYNIQRDLRYITIFGKRTETQTSLQAPTIERPTIKELPKVPVKRLNLTMANAKDREEIADIILKNASKRLKRVALFVIKGDNISGWRAMGEGINDETVSGINIPSHQFAFFKEVIERKVFYKGPPLKVLFNDKLMDAMGGIYPQEILAFPLTIRGKVVSILYGDNGDKALLLDEFDDLKNLMIMASLAMEMLILKRKIMEL